MIKAAVNRVPNMHWRLPRGSRFVKGSSEVYFDRHANTWHRLKNLKILKTFASHSSGNTCSEKWRCYRTNSKMM